MLAMNESINESKNKLKLYFYFYFFTPLKMNPESLNMTCDEFMLSLGDAFLVDNYTKELTNSQLQYIAYKTNKVFGTDFTDDDVFDIIYEYIKAYEE